MQNAERGSNPLYVTIPFVYFQLLAQAYYGREVPDSFTATPTNQKVPQPDPTPGSPFNLKGVDVRFPLGTLCVVSGVSGSGKSTLVNRILMPPGWKSLRKRQTDGN